MRLDKEGAARVDDGGEAGVEGGRRVPREERGECAAGERVADSRLEQAG